MNRTKVHKSHITSSEAKSRGWSRIPSPAIQQETKKQEVGIGYMSEQFLTLTANNTTSTDLTASYTGNSIDNTWYYPYHTWESDWSGITPTIIREIVKEKEVTKMEQRTLFKVYVVDPKKNGKILLDGKLVIAVNENQAMLKAGVADIADKAGLDLEQVDVYVQTVGTFIRPRKETQRVKITKEGDD
ncbi:MAG: hypothetical protein U9R01_03695 [candidate division WOR-3 bacterium]|nr:hypothetical protein [candidate division WOR-3 bacterium]